MKNTKLFLGATLLFTLALFGITVAILPLLLSSDWARNTLVKKVNSSSPGQLALGDCDIGWSKGLQCSDISYHDQNYQVDAARLSGTQGLFALIMAPKNLGTITVEEPAVLITRPAPSSKEESADPPTEAGLAEDSPIADDKAANEPSAAEGDEQAGTWFWHTMSGEVLLKRAIVKIQQGEQEAQMLLRKGTLALTLASDTLTLDLALATGTEQTAGEVKAVGTAHLPSVKGNLPDLMTADMQVTVTDVQLAPFLAAAPAETKLPRGRATLTADLSLKNTQGGDLLLRGPISMSKLDLSGGFLKEDHPRLDQLAFELHLQRDERKDWRLPELKMLSDFGTVDMQSGYGEQGLQAQGKGEFDLPVLFAQLPGLFRVQENLRLDNGRASITFELTEQDKVMQVKADATVEDLAGRQDSRSFVWKSPLTLNLNGSMNGDAPEVEKLALKADFLNIEGQGNLQHFTLKGSANLDQAVKEIGRIIQFDWNAGGRLNVDVETTKDKEERYTVQAKVDIADCRLSMKHKDVLPVHQFRFNGTLTTPGHFPAAKAEAADFTFASSSWAGELSGSLNGLYRDQGQIMAHYELDSDLMLARVTELLHRFDVLKEETSIAGEMKLKSNGYTEKDRLVVSTLDSRIKDFILYRKGKILQDPDLSLFTTKPEPSPNVEDAVRPLEKAESKDAFFAQGGGYNLIDTRNHRLVLRNISLNSGFADIRVDKVFLDDWQQKPAPAIKALQVSGRSDLFKLTTFLQQLDAISPEQKIGGDAVFSLDLAEKKEDIQITGTSGRGNTGTVKVDIDRFSYSKIKKKVKGRKAKEDILIERQKVLFRSRLHGDLMAGDLQFTTFDIESAPLSLQAGGEVQMSGKEPHFSLNGSATPDLASLVAVLNGMYPLGIEASGKKKEKFTLYYPLDPEKKANAKIDLRFATKVYADTFSKSGIDVNRLTLDTDMKQGIMATVLKGTLNNGWLQLSPRIDYTKTPPLLTMPEGEQILTDVHLEQALTEGLLQWVHPVFGALADPTGIINVRLDRFSLPLEEKGMEHIDFKISLDLTEVALEAKGVLNSILDTAGYTDRTLTIDNKSLTCEGVQGQISCSPIKVTIADSEMIISGSAGMDGSLNYLIEVPVTKRLIGKKGYELLKGTTLKVPIKGSKDKPIYSRRALMDASSDLLRQAAGRASKNILQEQVDKVVPDLLNNLFGN